ncbi:MAG: hypothetical protein ABR973_14685 [Candidatus Acidiferrales bacterium]|jgi:hypothetical protein
MRGNEDFAPSRFALNRNGGTGKNENALPRCFERRGNAFLFCVVARQHEFCGPGLVLEVHAHIKTIVIPICMVLAAPIAIAVHAGNIPVHLRAIFTVLRNIAIDPGAVGFEPLVAIRGRVAEGDMGHWQRERKGQSRAESQTNDLRFHSVPPREITLPRQ